MFNAISSWYSDIVQDIRHTVNSVGLPFNRQIGPLSSFCKNIVIWALPAPPSTPLPLPLPEEKFGGRDGNPIFYSCHTPIFWVTVRVDLVYRNHMFSS